MCNACKAGKALQYGAVPALIITYGVSFWFCFQRSCWKTVYKRLANESMNCKISKTKAHPWAELLFFLLIREVLIIITPLIRYTVIYLAFFILCIFYLQIRFAVFSLFNIFIFCSASGTRTWPVHLFITNRGTKYICRIGKHTFGAQKFYVVFHGIKFLLAKARVIHYVKGLRKTLIPTNQYVNMRDAIEYLVQIGLPIWTVKNVKPYATAMRHPFQT